MVREVVVEFLIAMKEFGLFALFVFAVNADPKPNIVLIVTDDLVRRLEEARKKEVLNFQVKIIPGHS